MRFKERMSLRLDPETSSLLDLVMKKTGIYKSDLIRWALKDFILKAENDELFKLRVKEYKAFMLLEDVKRKKILLGIYKQSKAWLKNAEKVLANPQTDNEPSNKRFSVFYNNDLTLLKEFYEAQKKLVEAMEDYVNCLKANGVKNGY
jgi:predicted DNA-binding protein